MATRPPHTMPLATHQWVGLLLFQARNTLLHVSVILGSSYTKKAMYMCDPTIACLDSVRSALEDALFAEHGHLHSGQMNLLRVYYPGRSVSLWYTRMPADPSRVRRQPRRPGGKWRLSWHNHLALAEMLYQIWHMTWTAWGYTLPAYGATTAHNRRLETLVPSGTALTKLQLWCEGRLYEEGQRGLIQWGPGVSWEIYVNGAKYFTPWAPQYAPADRSAQGDAP